MPQRSNDFQKLVLYLHKHNHPNVEIVESKILVDKETLESREVDIYLTTSLGNYQLNISIECGNKKRKADIGWVEMMKAKHDKLETSRLVLVNKAGFTRQAIKYANRWNIQTLKYDQINSASANPIFDFNDLVFKIFTQSVENVYFIVKKDNALINVKVAPDTAVFNMNSEIVGIANDVMNYLMKQKQAFEHFWKDGTEEHQYFELHWLNDNTLPIYLQENNTFTLESIEEIRISGKVDFKVRNFNTVAGQIDDKSFIWGKIIVDEKNKLLFIGTPKENGGTFSLIKQ